ncbi:oxygen-binding di-iron domain-containing protein [Endothiovibrio diazotrophicus]
MVVLDRLTAPEEPGPVLLYEEGDHRLYWLGLREETAFRCNSYLIVDGDQVLLVDPGNRDAFGRIREEVAAVVDPTALGGLVVCHQDPDVAASLGQWLALNPEARVVTSPRTRVLLPHYGVHDYRCHDIEEVPELALPSGSTLRFLPAPFLHSPMAFATFDTASGFLFSGDLFAAIDTDWRLVVDDFSAHAVKLDLFHIDYMASNVAARGFVRSLAGLDIRAICPQHGSIIPQRFVADALVYLERLRCGTDLLYPDLVG